MTELHHMIREIREYKGISREALADNIGIAVSTLERIENGRTDPKYSTLKKILLCLEAHTSVTINESKSSTIASSDPHHKWVIS
ncbi:helix-turn-helix domain-containing protein [Vibrio porteresiae]|uniref:Helix-turn-helix transcriptional regulator n=1 Tax=Vibrio porteresiae DSM 19223 TaxID=1123496 RepID=A0ABZ0QI75_9VIBR|nr:helix-turn-helix transcriptional regulator [Vibrio porteresiae]WPC75200.1 helix-turn-helix transcriptional regulator [Vibrio porteresiae DSM 19223]